VEERYRDVGLPEIVAFCDGTGALTLQSLGVVIERTENSDTCGGAK